MNRTRFLALTNLGKQLRPKYRWATATLILGCTFASMLPWVLFAWWLARVLHIPDDAPVKDQPNGALWFTLVMTGFVVLVVIGYLTGFALLAWVLRWFRGWTAEQVRKLIFESRVPAHWLKDPDALARYFSEFPSSAAGLGDAPSALQQRMSAEFLAQLELLRRKMKPWRLWTIIVLMPLALIALAWVSHLNMVYLHDASKLTTPAARTLAKRGFLVSLAWSGALYLSLIGGTLWWGWRITTKFSPKCRQCGQPVYGLQGRQGRQALASAQCPFCYHPLFS